MSNLKLSVDDPEFVEKIIFEVKAQGHFDIFRKSCLADVECLPAYQNLHSRVEDSVQKFLNRQVWTPETNKIKLREEMRYSIVHPGFLESGVSRIVDQVMEQKMDSIQTKVEEILYKYVGIEKPDKRHNGSLEVDTDDLLPTELEQISPDSDKKSSMSEVKDEQIEEEIVEDEDFESPAFEPVEPAMEKNENSNLSAISGLTSQDSVEEKSEMDVLQETQLSQFSSSQEEEPLPLPPGEEPPLPFEEPSPPSVEPPPPAEEPLPPAEEPLPPAEEPLPPAEEHLPPTEPTPPSEEPLTPSEEPPPPTEEPPPPAQELPPPPPAEKQEKSQFDLSLAGGIEFTRTKRKSLSLDDSSEAEKEKILQPHDVPSNTMEIDNLYENDTTDSSEMRMEIDLKADDTAESSKVEESSQDSTVSKEKEKDKHRHHHKSSSSRDKHHHKSSRHHHSSSKSRYDDKHRRSSGKHKRTSGEKEKEKTSGDKEKTSGEKEKTSGDRDRSSSSHKDRKSSSSKHQKDDHYQEKSSSRKRRSTDRDSNEGKDEPAKSSDPTTSISKPEETSEKPQEKKPIVVDSMLSENMEISIESKSAKKEKSSILVKYDYLKSKSKEEIDDGFCGFVDSPHKLPDNPWFECLRKEAGKDQKKSLEQKKTDGSLNLQLPRAKKQKSKSPESPTSLTNGNDETTPEVRAQNIAQQQRYTDEDLYKPRFDFGNRSRRRGQITENVNNESIESKQ